MAITNHERVGKALELLKDGVAPFLERELKSEYQQRWFDEVKTMLSPQQLTFAGTEKNPKWDIATVLAVMWNQWNEVFRKTSRAGRTDTGQRATRSAQQVGASEAVYSDDADRALDTAAGCSRQSRRRKPTKSTR